MDDIMEFTIQVGIEEGDTEEVDQATRQLLGELRDQDVESVELVTEGEVPEGTKSAEAVTIGSIAVVVLPAVLPKLVEFLQAWTMRGQDRTIKFKGKIEGQEIEFEGNPEDLKSLLATLSDSGESSAA
ncbi:MAG: hypothetical protein PVF74_01720 [Anaerolineales bacterium]